MNILTLIVTLIVGGGGGGLIAHFGSQAGMPTWAWASCCAVWGVAIGIIFNIIENQS